MSPQSPHDIRNLALVGAVGTGKTTLLEALMLAAGELSSAGSIEGGDTLSDFDPHEKQLGHSLYASLAHLEWAHRWINLIDAPGTADFLGRALPALAAVETAAVCVDAAAGVQMATQRLMAHAQGLCRLVIVTRIDASGSRPAETLAALQQAFGKVCLPINLPSSDGSRVVDCFFSPEYQARTAFCSVLEAHDALIDQVVELDEALMEIYLDQGQSLNPEQLHAPFEQALREGHLIPVCFTSARTGAGLHELLEIIAQLMPDPTEGNPPAFLKGEGEEARPVAVSADPQGHVLAHVFQVANDPYRGKLAIFRLHQGRLQAGASLFIGDQRKPFKAAHLLRLQGRQQVEIPGCVAGDICALARAEDIHRDAVLHDSRDEDGYHLRPTDFPSPIAGMALMPHKAGDEQKLAEALHQLRDEDACLAVEFDAQARRTVLRGLGDLHLRTAIEQLQRRWNIGLDTALPTVPYRETIAGGAEARYRHKKQSGGAGQFGEVALRVEPLARGAGFEFQDAVKGGAIPGQFMGAVEKGVRQALAEGALAGFPVHDLRVVVMDGKHHSVDSNEISFVSAARQAVLQALAEARPLLLEPLVSVVIRAAEGHFGTLSGEFSSRRGRVVSTDSPRAGWIELSAQVPLAEMEGFEMRIKSLLAGDSDFTIAPDHYEPAPSEVQQRLAREWSARARAG